MENKSKISIATITVFIIVAVFIFWYWSQRKTAVPKNIQAPVSELLLAEAEDTLGGQIFRATQNPGSKLPKTNPFQDIDINPLKNIVKNPF